MGRAALRERIGERLALAEAQLHHERHMLDARRPGDEVLAAVGAAAQATLQQAAWAAVALYGDEYRARFPPEDVRAELERTFALLGSSRAGPRAAASAAA